MIALNKEEKKNSLSKEQDRFFEILNAKYNRLWEQETQLAVLIGEIIAGISFAIIAFDTTLPVAIERLSIAILIIIFLLGFVTLGVGEIDVERIKTKKWLGMFVVTELRN